MTNTFAAVNGLSIAAERPVRVVLVEDDLDDAFLIEADIRKFVGSVDVDHVESLAQLEAAVSDSHYDVVLLDLGLPDSDGLATFERAEAVSTSPIVILSGRNDNDEASLDAIRLGAQDYVPKSAIGTGLLGRVIQHAIERAEVQDLRRSQGELFEALISNSLDAVRVLDEHGVIEFMNSPAGDSSNDESQGRAKVDFVHPDDVGEWTSTFDEVVRGGPGACGHLTVRVRGPRGYRWMAMQLTNLLEHPVVGGVLLNAHDVTERRDFENQLLHQATHDSLTGLPNRSAARDAVEAALNHGVTPNDLVAVLFLDLDQFKIVNDTRGHQVGDELLVAVAGRLGSVLRRNDLLARQGGDEFVVVANHVHGVDEVPKIAKRVQDSLRDPIHVGEHTFHMTVSVGVAVADSAAQDADTVLGNADAAMYRAKRAGRDRIRMFDPSLESELDEQRDVEAELRTALDSDQLKVHYQPILDVQTRTLRAVEALVRWEHPTRGLLGPAAFMGVAEDSGLVVHVDRSVLREACIQTANWNAQLGIRIRLNVNMSSATVIDPGFPAFVDEIMRQHQIDPQDLCFELTETAILLYPTEAEATMRALRALGVGVALDDFGTGYSSLTHLQNLPLTGIKIDRSFIAGLGIQPRDTIIVRSTVSLGRDLDLLVTAEGVENADQLAILESFGCALAQGYMLDRPMPAEDLHRRFVDTDPRTTVWHSPLRDVGFDRARR